MSVETEKKRRGIGGRSKTGWGQGGLGVPSGHNKRPAFNLHCGCAGWCMCGVRRHRVWYLLGMRKQKRRIRLDWIVLERLDGGVRSG